jgi:hypothetical protein
MTLCDRLERFFHQHAGRWIDGRELSRHAGSYGWRTRVSELRAQRGMNILNRQRRVKATSGETYVISEYCYMAPAGQMGLLEK